MRIILVSPFPPARDGLADYSAGMWRGYEDAGHAVAGISPGPTAMPPTTAPMLGSLTFRPLKALALARSVRRWRPDLLHVQHTVATYGLRLAPLWLLVLYVRAIGVQTLVTHHEVTRDTLRLGIVGRLYYRVAARVTQRNHVHTAGASRALMNEMGVPPGSVLTHPHPIFDLPQGGTSPEQLSERFGLGERSVLLQFGFIQVEKGLRELVEAVGELVRRRRDFAEGWCVVVAGDVRRRPAGFARFEQADRDYLAAVRERVGALGLDGIFVFTSHVPAADVRGWFELAALVTLPYTNTEQSGVANIAVAVQVPVLATSIPGLGELFAELPSIPDLAAEPFSQTLEATLNRMDEVTAEAAIVFDQMRRHATPALLVHRAVTPAETAQ